MEFHHLSQNRKNLFTKKRILRAARREYRFKMRSAFHRLHPRGEDFIGRETYDGTFSVYASLEATLFRVTMRVDMDSFMMPEAWAA